MNFNSYLIFYQYLLRKEKLPNKKEPNLKTEKGNTSLKCI